MTDIISLDEIYLDGNATSAVLPAAAVAATHAMTQGFGNPSSTHASGFRAKAMMDAVRTRARRLLGAGDGHLLFNSGATEGIQTAVLSALCAVRERRLRGEPVGKWLLWGATEHKAVPEALAHWNRLLGLDLSLRALPVDADGRHELSVLRTLAPDTALLCTMAANNETGVISDLAGIERVLNETRSQAYWLADCVQALGKLPLNLSATRIDYAPFSGHKLHGPKGIGMLYVRADAPYTPLMVGGGQEQGLRSGTENMAGIAALGAVLAALEEGNVFQEMSALQGFRDKLAASLRAALPGIVFNMPFAGSLPTTLNFSVQGMSSSELLDLFDAAGVRVSSGSACSASKAAPSHVLEAMGLPHGRSSAAIRMSFGPLTGAAMIDAACERIAHCGRALKSNVAPGRDAVLPPVAASSASSVMDGLVRWTAGGAVSWLLADQDSRDCVIVDPLAALVPALLAHVRSSGYRVCALLHTGPDNETARRELRETLAVHLGAAASDALHTMAPATLVFGRYQMCRTAVAGGHAVYLLRRAAAASLSPAAVPARTPVQFAFIGALAPDQLDPALIDADTLLCSGREGDHALGTSLRAEAEWLAAHASGAITEHAEADDQAMLDRAMLTQLLKQHPDAQLIDVREAYEYAAGNKLAPGGRPALNIPLSRLTAYLGTWLPGGSAPLVFFCRTGKRSGKAAACLRRLGHQQAWHIEGGLAAEEM
jgi:cysteine sulfinate desulfinase/cysteine desulfurase-like protein/rhodanese-related sulfurtransferase